MISRKYLVVLGAFIVHLSLGSFYTYGNINPYIIQYMRNASLSRSSVNNGNVVWLFGLLAFGLGATMSFGGYVNERIGPTLTVLIGGWLMSFNITITSVTIKTYLAVVALTYGLLPGLGMGLCYGVSLGCATKWFPHRKGLISGIIVGGFGFSSMIFDYVQIKIVSTNISQVTSETKRLPYSFIYLGVIYSIMILIGSLLLKNQAEDIIEYSSNSTRNFFNEIFSEQINDKKNFLPTDLFWEKDFWILWITFALNTCNVIIISSLWKGFGLFLKIEDSSPKIYLTYIGLGGSFFNCCGRIIWGFLHDKLPYKYVMLFLTVTTAILMGTFILCCNIKNPIAMYTVWICLLNIMIGGNFAVFPATCTKLFGEAHLVENYGLLFTATSVGSIVTSIATTVIGLNNNTYDFYFHTFISGTVLSLISSLLTIIFRGKSIIKSSC